MSTIIPHEPKPGYNKRWLKQALGLTFQSPVYFFLFALMSLGLGSIVVLVRDGFLSLGLPYGYILSSAVTAFAAPFLIAVLFRNLFILEKSNNIGSLHQCWKLTRESWPRMALLMVILSAVRLFFDGVADVKPLLPVDASITDFIRVALEASGDPVGLAFIYLAWSSVFVFGLKMGVGAENDDVAIFDKIASAKMPKVCFHIMVVILISVVFSETFGMFNPLFIYVMFAWNYVACREIIGGISENKKQETQVSVPNAVPDAT